MDFEFFIRRRSVQEALFFHPSVHFNTFQCTAEALQSHLECPVLAATNSRFQPVRVYDFQMCVTLLQSGCFAAASITFDLSYVPKSCHLAC